MNQLLSQIGTLPDRVNALNEEKEFSDPETASSSGMSHVPSRIPSPRGMLSRDFGLPHHTRNSMGTSGNVFESLPARESPSLPGVTHEEAQVFVYDLNQFVTVQLLEVTPAVLSLGKLCKDNGYSYEWVSQRSRATIDPKRAKYYLQNGQFRPGLFTNTGSDSSCSTPSPESLEPDASQVSGDRVAFSSSSDSVSERRDEQSSRQPEQQPEIDSLAGILDWLTEFNDNPVEELPTQQVE